MNYEFSSQEPVGVNRAARFEGNGSDKFIIHNSSFTIAKFQSAFTLIEMVVVLVVLSVAAHLAVRELGKYRDAKKVEEADRQLELVRAAVWCVPDGGEPFGFLADVGRLPHLRNGELSELWKRPAELREYAVLAATTNNICIADDDGRRALKDEDVFVPTGWRGPYIYMPLGCDALLDPWGNPLEECDTAHLRRIWTDESGCATNIAHYGVSAQTRERKDASLLPDGGATSTLTIYPEIVGDNAFSGEIEYRWFGPADGMITGAVKKVAYPNPVRFEGLTPGIRIIKEYEAKVARRVIVRPGDNVVSIRIVK